MEIMSKNDRDGKMMGNLCWGWKYDLENIV